MTGIGGSATGSSGMVPMKSVYSDDVRHKLLKLRQNTKNDYISQIDWDEWALSFT
jgi:hypothetical protein